MVGGRNGFGAKLANIFSTYFEIEVGDSLNKKKYRQIWRDNMHVMEQPDIEAFTGSDYTKVIFRPHF